MKIFSKTLNEDVEINASETSEGMLLSHDDLLSITFEYPSRFRYQLIPEHISDNHSVYRCIMEDNETGRQIECIGESTPETLTTQISRNYPSLMAAKRAFDEAMITILQLPGKFYSNQQITTDEAKSAEKESIEEIPVNNGIKETIEEPDDAQAAPDADQTAEEESSAEAATDETSAEQEIDLDNVKDFVMAFSVSKGKSFREVYADKTRWENIKKWLNNVPDMKYNDELRNEQLTYVRKVIAKEKEMEEKKSA